MEENSSLAYSEIYEILKLIEDEYANRIPKKVMDFFENERDKEYTPTIDVSIPLDKQNLKRETMVILAILNYNYWCDSEEEKNEIKEELIRNDERKKQEEKELAERYNPENLFKKKVEKKESTADKSDNMKLIEYKEQNLMKKILRKIMKYFRKGE